MPAKKYTRLHVRAILLGVLGLMVLMCVAVVEATQPANATPAKAAAFAPVGATPTSTPCVQNYTYITSTASIVTAANLIAGSQCGRCTTTIGLPFPFTLYGQTYTTANVLNAGNVQFATTDTSNNSCPPPFAALGPAILPAWDTVLDTGQPAICQAILGRPCGVYTSVTGIAPDRIFNIEWVARRSGSSTYTYHFELSLHETTGVFDFVYAGLIPPPSGANSVVGVQNGTTAYTYFACAVPYAIYQGLLIRWSPGTCGPPYTPTVTPTRTSTPTSTPTPQCARSWNMVSSPNPSSTLNALFDVSALSANDMWAVGTYDIGLGRHVTFTLHWDGNQWTHVPSPSPSTSYDHLNGVEAISSNDVWAVGYTFATPAYPSTLIEHWNGIQWTVFPSPNPGIAQNYLRAVSAASPNDVWAVGYFSNSNTLLQTLVEHWDGAQWTVVPSPNVGTDANQFWDVSAVSANDVWAVGDQGNHLAGNVFALAEHWDGTQWSVVAVSDPAGAISEHFYSVSAVTSNDVWAVGDYGSTSGGNVLTEHWDGTQWSVVPAPGGEGPFRGVSAASSNDVWAVGARFGGSFSEHWDGSQWEVVPSPNPGTSTLELQAVAVIPNHAWTAGYAVSASSPDQTLTMQYGGPCITPSPTPNLTLTPTRTPTIASTRTPTFTYTTTPTGSPVPTNTQTPTPCTISFTDVQPTDYFYEAVTYLYCHGAISGYGSVFLPYNLTTRGQLTKIVVLAEGFTIYTPVTPTFQDVPANHTFYQYIETAYHQGIISGYTCGTGCLEFRPGANVTRAQLCKIIVLAENWALYAPPTPTFRDVARDDPFFAHIETAYSHAIISGYNCGAGCLEFRPNASATRGQICNVGYN